MKKSWKGKQGMKEGGKDDTNRQFKRQVYPCNLQYGFVSSPIEHLLTREVCIVTGGAQATWIANGWPVTLRGLVARSKK